MTNYNSIKTIASSLYASWKTLDIFDSFTIDELNGVLASYVEVNIDRYKQILKVREVDYSVIDNYDMTETYTRSGKQDGSFKKGAEQSTSTTTNNTITNENNGQSYNGTSNGKVTESGTTSDTKTDKTTTTTSQDINDTIGAIHKVTNDISKPITNTNTVTKGDSTSRTVHSEVPFDTATAKEKYIDANTSKDGIVTTVNETSKVEKDITEDEDEKRNSSSTSGSTKSDTVSTDSGQNSSTNTSENSDNYTTNSNSAGNSTSDGKIITNIDARTDLNSSKSEENYTLRRKGNIGTMTSTDVMKKHMEFWMDYNGIQILLQDLVDNFFVIGG